MIKQFIPESIGGRKDNYYNRLVNRFVLYLKDQAVRKVVREVKPARILEIGVGKARGACLMIKEAKRMGISNIEYIGVDVFSSLPEGEPNRLDEWGHISNVAQILGKLGVEYKLFQGKSCHILPEIVPNLLPFDIIHIDGGHSKKTAMLDWNKIQPLIHSKTIIIFDDYARYPGVTEVVNSIDEQKFEIERNPSRGFAIIKPKGGPKPEPSADLSITVLMIGFIISFFGVILQANTWFGYILIVCGLIIMLTGFLKLARVFAEDLKPRDWG